MLKTIGTMFCGASIALALQGAAPAPAAHPLPPLTSECSAAMLRVDGHVLRLEEEVLRMDSANASVANAILQLKDSFDRAELDRAMRR